MRSVVLNICFAFCVSNVFIMIDKMLSLGDCDEALKLDENYLKAFLRRGRSYMEMEKYEEAVRDFEHVNKMERGNHEYRNLLATAKVELKKSKRKDYYKILGIDRNANDEEIKKAYRKRALVHHPGMLLI